MKSYAECSTIQRLLDLSRALFERLAGIQNPDGGFPETFLGDRSGCWTTAEIYLALAGLRSRETAVTMILDRSESFLLGVLHRQGDGGLPFHERPEAAVRGPRTSLSTVDVTAAFLCGWTLRHPREAKTKARLSAWLRASRAAGPGSGFGIRPGDRSPRAYSTAYALMALAPDESTRVDAQTLQSWQDPNTGAWPFRPGMPPSRLATCLALAALDSCGLLPTEQEKAEGWLFQCLECEELQEEDSALVPEGYQLSFLYFPYLVSVAHLLRLTATRFQMRKAAQDTRIQLRRLAFLLARQERLIRRTGRPCPQLRDEHAWHYIDFAHGYGGIVAALRTLPAAERAAFDGFFARAGNELATWGLARELALPLRREARVLALRRGNPAQRSHNLATHMERVFQFATILLFCSLREIGAEGRICLRKILSTPAKGLSDLFEARKAFQKAGTISKEGAQILLAHRLVMELGQAFEGPTMGALSALRNLTSHGWPVAEPKRVALHENEWISFLDRLQCLRDSQLVEVERLSHEVASGHHVYQWSDLDDPSASGIIRTAHTLYNLLTVTDTEGDPVEMRGVFVRDRGNPGGLPLGLLPFTGIARCTGCGSDRLFLYARHTPSKTASAVLTLCCTEQCGTQIHLGLPVSAFFGT